MLQRCRADCQCAARAGVAALDPDLVQATATYDQLINGLQKAGWDIGKDLFGAPYDFRLAADGLQQVSIL